MSGPPPGDGERVSRSGSRANVRERPPSLIALLALVGPTGTGKSATALLVADRLGGEIIGCDAVQVYRGFDAATAKPSSEERRRVPHHLIDVVDPRADFSLASYVESAERVIRDVASRGKIPIVVGGTGLYLRGLLRGVVRAPARDVALRDRLRALARRFGAPRLHRWLHDLDPSTAERLSATDTQRIVRGLELALSGSGRWSDRLREEGTWQSGLERFECLKIGLDMEREALNRRLSDRVDAFFESGLIAEVRRLRAEGVPPGANAFKAIGYREVLDAMMEGRDPETVRDAVRTHSRRYAKRQRTWFRKEPGVRWMDAAEGPAALAERIRLAWESRAAR